MNKPFPKPICQPNPGLTLVIVPVQSGDSTGVFAPKLGDYKNTVVKYLADNKVFLFDKDGNWTEIGETNIPGVTIDTALSLSSTNAVQNKVITQGINDVEALANSISADLYDETLDRQAADNILQGNIDAEALARGNADGVLQGNIDAEALARGNADGILQGNIDAEALARANAISGVETKINRNLLNDLIMSASADSVTLTEQKINPNTGAITTEANVLPSASATTAGTISATEYQAIITSEELTQAILEGAVAIAGISASPTQADLTNEWLTATGYTEVINRASIYDIDNSLIWTYYTNAQLWYSATASLTISTFSNSTAGTILGSATDGNVSANIDGTGTVSGWSTVKNDITSLQTNKADSSSLATVATTGLYSDLTGAPTLATVATTGLYSDLSGAPTVPTITMTSTDPGEGQPLAADSFIAVYTA